MPRPSYSQNRVMDSLQIVLAKSKEDSAKVNLLLDMAATSYTTYDYENSLRYSKEALALSKKINYEAGESGAYFALAGYYGDANQLDESYNNSLKVLAIAQRRKDTAAMITAKTGFAMVAAYSGKFKEAISLFDTIMNYYESRGYKGGAAFIRRNIGMTYGFLNNYSEAERYNVMALKFYEETNNLPRIAECYNLRGDTYMELRDYKGALSAYQKALDIYEHQNGKPDESYANGYCIALMQYSIGRTFFLLGKKDSALSRLNTALTIIQNKKLNWAYRGVEGQCIMSRGEIYELAGDSALAQDQNKMYLLSMEEYERALKKNLENGYGKMAFENDNIKLYIHIGNLNLKLGQYEKARKYLTTGLRLATERQQKTLVRDAYQHFSELYNKLGNAGLALENYQRYIACRDSIVNEESVRTTAFYQMQYEEEKQNKLRQDKQIATETKLKNQTRQKYFYIAILALLGVITFFIIRNYYNQKKLNRLEVEAHSKEKTELELQSLKAQMNPHFMFNCINSIDSFIQTNDKYNATLYLNKFAKLIRNVLDSSKQNLVSFSKDIETLKLYIELEELRHENKFRTKLKIDPELMTSDYKVPPLIIQPFVENGILHGLKNRPGNEGQLTVTATKTGDDIEYLITDNGIGRTAAASIRQNKESSYGMQLSSDRVKLFNREREPSVYIEDLYENEKAAGTIVRVILKNV